MDIALLCRFDRSERTKSDGIGNFELLAEEKQADNCRNRSAETMPHKERLSAAMKIGFPKNRVEDTLCSRKNRLMNNAPGELLELNNRGTVEFLFGEDTPSVDKDCLFLVCDFHNDFLRQIKDSRLDGRVCCIVLPLGDLSESIGVHGDGFLEYSVLSISDVRLIKCMLVVWGSIRCHVQNDAIFQGFPVGIIASTGHHYFEG
mmetsp:Transcript_19469/g.30511  ORF Transcript_19469/g.30511 Transcript_19469/m.30511 type:complete len:203 (+) Transcript_19469:266-874(+)